MIQPIHVSLSYLRSGTFQAFLSKDTGDTGLLLCTYQGYVIHKEKLSLENWHEIPL